MTRAQAKRIAEMITNAELQLMFNTAKVNIGNWTEISIVNKGLTKGAAWNILASDFDVNKNYSILAKTNMVREFGAYLPNDLKPQKKVKKSYSNPIHQDPQF